MKFKKSLSAALAVTTFMSSAAVVAYAEVDEAMKTALTYVKQRIEIPEELEKFDYSSGTVNNRNRYTFTWSSETENSWKSLSVGICGKVITSYNYNSYSDSDEETAYSFGKLSQAELLEKAESWIKKLNPTVYKNIEIVADSLNVSISGERARVTIRRVSGGVPVNGQTGSIVVNKNTGELISYNLSWTMGATFAKPEKAIGTEAAIESFKTEMPLKLVYTAEYDYETKQYTPHLIYRQTQYGTIDALTGKLSTFEESYDTYADGDVTVEEDSAETETGVAGSNGVSFTDAELEKMEKEGSLVTAEESLAELMELGFMLTGNNPEVTYSNCYYSDSYEAYLRSYSFTSNDNNYYPVEDPVMPVEEVVAEEEVAVEEIDNSVYGNALINAETGELINFYSWGGEYKNGKLTEESAEALLDSCFEKLAGDKASEFRPEAPSFHYSDYDKDGNPAKNAKIQGAYTHSSRYAHDIPCNTESMYIGINGEGKVYEYNLSYYGIEYPEPEGIISADEAYDSYFDKRDCSLQYRLAIKNKKTLSAMVYAAQGTVFVDAFSGNITNYNGTEIIEGYKGGYTDLEDSKYRKIAEKLAMYNITLMDENGRLNEDEIITRNEFSNLVNSIGCWYYNRTGGEKALTRQFAAKILTNNIISEKCAEIEGIFKSPFSDVKDTSKYVGYIAIANALGLMEGEDGKFRPAAKITRGEALQLVYDYLT